MQGTAQEYLPADSDVMELSEDMLLLQRLLNVSASQPFDDAGLFTCGSRALYMQFVDLFTCVSRYFHLLHRLFKPSAFQLFFFDDVLYPFTTHN